MTAPIMLNIGAGETVIEGWTPIDRKLGTEAFPLNYPDNSVEEIRASHILEHFAYADVEKALAEWLRVLKPGGRIRIAVPDFDRVMDSRIAGGDPQEMWRFYLMGGQEHADDFHRSAFTHEILERFMGCAGFENIRPWASLNTDTAAHPVSLCLQGHKPDIEPKTAKCVALMSIPRVGWNESWGCIMDVLAPRGIGIRRFTGALWGQCLQTAMEKATDIDWLLAIDYDSVFTGEQLDEMIRLFSCYPEIDALAALQCRRGKNSLPLASICEQFVMPSQIAVVNGEKRVRLDRGPIPVGTAHFGLTLIRTAALKRMPKPWFMGLPNVYGVWGDGKANEDDQPIPWIAEVRKAAFGGVDPLPDTDFDDDIFFWNRWRQAGNTIYIAPEVRIGHLQVFVTDFDEDMATRSKFISEWRDEHKLDKTESIA